MRLRILQWNVWIKEDPAKIANEILKINPDIVCAQELKQNLPENIDTAETISKIIKYNYFYKEAATWDKRSDITSQGNAIFSRYPIIFSDSVFLKPFIHNPKDATHEGRVYFEISIKLESRQITFGTTHLSYSYKLKNTKSRKIEADLLSKVLSSKNDNFVFAGDLNAVPKSYVVTKILENKNLKNAGPEFDKKTWPTKPFDKHGFKEDKLNWRIDYVFASKDINVVSNQIIETKVSDHLPILIEVEI